MIKKRSKMNNIIMWGLIATASVSLASVGFASWVINTITPAQSDNVKVSVGDVVNRSLTASIETEGTNLSVSFDHNGNNKNFTSNDDKTEKLSFTIKNTFTAPTGTYIASLLGGVEYEFTIGADLENLINKGATDNSTKYIKSPSFIGDGNKSTIGFTWTNNSLSNKTLTPNNSKTFSADIPDNTVGTGNTLTFTTTFTFEWGEAFLGVNPCETPTGTADTSTTLTMQTLTARLNAFKTAYNASGTFLSVTVTPIAKK